MTEKAREAQAGAIYVEFAISILAFMMLMVITVDVLRLSYETANAQFIVNRAIRDAALNVDPTKQYNAAELERQWPGPIDPQTRFNNVEALVGQTAERYGVRKDTLTIEICAMNGTCGSAGRGGEMISIKISYPFKMMFYTFTSTITASAVARNEPFRMAQS